MFVEKREKLNKEGRGRRKRFKKEKGIDRIRSLKK